MKINNVAARIWRQDNRVRMAREKDIPSKNTLQRNALKLLAKEKRNEPLCLKAGDLLKIGSFSAFVPEEMVFVHVASHSEWIALATDKTLTQK